MTGGLTLERRRGEESEDLMRLKKLNQFIYKNIISTGITNIYLQIGLVQMFFSIHTHISIRINSVLKQTFQKYYFSTLKTDV